MPKNWRLERRHAALRNRARIVQAIRAFFFDRDYLEVETPHRIPAPAPESHIDAVPSGAWFLQPSPELCMKRLLAAGYDKIFQICRCWREGERGRLHVPEFTLLEWYRAECDYRGLMDECEELIREVVRAVGIYGKILFRGQRIDLSETWEKISVNEAFLRYAGMSVSGALEQDLFDEVMVRDIEPYLGANSPAFLYDYPGERGALARRKEEDPALAERFELYIGGLEIANAFSELTDPGEQRRRFLLEQVHRRSLGKAVYPLPEKFLEELGEMPPSAGIALGIDRLVMVLLDAPAIDDVIAFAPEDL